jgi:DNA-directed RNA polymerase specialized sigma24 family protein
MKDHPAVLKYARAFAEANSIDPDDMLQEARIAVWRAECAVESGQYDPRKASFNTYATTAVYRRMCSVLDNHKRILANGGDNLNGGRDTFQLLNYHRKWTDSERDINEIEEIPDQLSPGPDRALILAELIRELPDDARAVVDLVLGDLPGDLVDQVLDGVRGASVRLRSHIRRALRLRRGDRAAAAFSAITEMLASM